MSNLHPYLLLDEIANFANGKALVTSKYDKNGMFPVYGSNGIIAFSNEKRYDDGVTVIGRVGAYCGSLYFTNGPAWITDNAIVSTGKNGLESHFLYYLFQTLQLNRTAIGSAQPLLTQSGLKVIKVRVPPIETRIAIQTILSALDDKIENNRRMNETLEEMAQAIFKSWFVDFDPVHAKAAGNAPVHMDAETAALFPSSFGDDGLPVGWREEHLPNLIDFKEGPGLRNWQYTNSDEGVRFINIRCIKNRDLELTTANRVTEAEAFGRYAHFLLEAGDLVVSTSGTLGRFSFVREEHLPLMLNTSVIRIRPIHKKSTREFLFAYLGSKEFQSELEIRATGSAQKNFGPMHLNQMHLKVPKFVIINAYSQRTSPIVEKFLLNQQENQTLAELRDTLLPKLMSGEIRVKDAERAVEAAI